MTKRFDLALAFLSVFQFLSCNLTLGDTMDVIASITVDDYTWRDGNHTPIDFGARFPGAGLTKNHAPLPIFFQGWQSTPRENILEYEWDFGDGSPRFYGFNASHVYEIPGIYTAILTVRNSSGTTDTDTVTVEVLERNGAVYYVDSSLGSDLFDGLAPTAGSGNRGPWRTADRAFSEMTTDLYKSGDSILFNRGQTFELSESGIMPGAWPAWGYMFGAYGSGAKPVIQYSGADEAIIIHMMSIGFAHVSFVDLDFRFDDYHGHKAGVFFFAQGGGTRNILFLRVDALDLYSDLFVIGQYSIDEIASGTFFVDSSIRNTYIDPEKSVTQFAVWGSRFACLNSKFDLSGNHIGYTSVDKGVIAGNTFSRPAFGRTALRISGFQGEGAPWNPELTSNNVQISENSFHGWVDPETVGRSHNGGGTRYNMLLVQLSPNGPWNQIIRDIVFERNVITNAENSIQIGAAENITVRNNIMISNDSSLFASAVSIVDANKPSKNIIISNNTIVARNSQYSGNRYNMGGIVKVLSNATQVMHPFGYSNHQDISIKDNIFHVNGGNQFSRFIYVDEIDEVLPQVESVGNLFFVSEGTQDGQLFQIGDAGSDLPTAQYITLSQWQALGQDVTGFFADPQFANLNGADGQFSGYGFDADLRTPASGPTMGKGAPGIGHYGNQPPVLSPIEARTIPVGRQLQFQINSTDADNDPLIFSATGP
jgi:PKD repeat protein